jgi:pentatricopeptide repeat protein
MLIVVRLFSCSFITLEQSFAVRCAGEQWEKASELFDQLQGAGCKPDAVTFAALVGVYEKCGQWRPALRAWDMMHALGFHPDVGMYHALLEVLWHSGCMLPQASGAPSMRTHMFNIQWSGFLYWGPVLGWMVAIIVDGVRGCCSVSSPYALAAALPSPNCLYFRSLAFFLALSLDIVR